MKKRGKSIIVYFLTVLSVVLLSVWGSRAVTVISENSPIERKSRIIIDPGHGGEDGGATSCAGILESRYNLEISLRLNDLLQLLGHETELIRTTDTSVYTTGETIAQKKISDLKQRVKTVNETPNALLLSIHQNHFSDSRYRGAQVFYASTEGSRELAKKLQSTFVSTLNPGSSRKSKKCEGIYLMERIRCPGILIECGFLSNPEEEALLRDGAYQKKLSCVIAATVGEYLSNT